MKTILAIDDEEDILRLLQFVLERVGYTVKTATSGVDGLEVVNAERPDLIICDIMMPYMDGLEVVRRLKAREDTRDIPVIMLTARTSDESVSDAWQEGVDVYLPKPFSPPELMSFVTRLAPLS